VRSRVRVSLVALLTAAVVVAGASAAQAAGIESFFAANCKVSTCKKVPKAEEKEKAELEGFTQAGGHPNFGITDFKIDTVGTFPNEAPTGLVTHIRTDVAPGVSTNPQAVPKCSMEEYGAELPGTNFFVAPGAECAGSVIGVNEAVVYLGPKPSPEGGDLPLEGSVYNLVQPKGLSSDFGVALKLPKPLTELILSGTPYKGSIYEKGQYYAHTLIEGNVEWGAEAVGTGKADYHDFFEIKVSTALPLISSRLIFKGNIGTGGFLTNPTSCTGVGPQTTTTLHLEFEGGETAKETYSSPIGTENCGLVPFEPGFALKQGAKGSDAPDGITTEFSLPHDPNPGAGHYDSSQVEAASIVLPEGLTMNPSAASGLEDCTPSEIAIGTKESVTCPEGSKLGTVALNVPGLPNGSLEGYLFLGGPASGPITGGSNPKEPEYTVYVDAESERYGVDVRLKGLVKPNAETGRLTTTFTENPEQPFTSLTVHFNGGPLAPLANGLKCEASTATTTFTPFTNTAAMSPAASFEVTGCASSIPFSLAQSTEYDNAEAGAHNSYTFGLARSEGQQYLEKIKTTLPSGLIGEIPAVTLCGEPQAKEGTCGSASKIGTATVTAGSGSSPYSFSGPVYMTGPYEGAPFGLSINVPAVAGPFNLGNVITRSTININPTTARVTAETTLPTIVKGVPLRLRSLSVDVNRQGFLLNPTNCATEYTETSLTSTFGGTQTGLNSPLQAEGCSSLAFKPTFAASTGAKHSKTNGASLVTTLTQPGGQSNIKSVFVTLPKALPSRLTTLQKACLAKTFEENPLSCAKVSPGSEVGTATAVTPVLPVVMKGPAFLVSHSGEEFPSLELVLEGDGVRTIVEGKTHIKNGITTTNFEATPDVPVSSITVNLPVGPHSALTTENLNTNLCTAKLLMPTIITGQNGKQNKYNTVIAPTGCGVQIVGHKVVGNTAYLTIRTYAAGRISGSGKGLSTVRRSLGAASKATTLKVPLSSGGRSKGRPFKAKIRVGFVPKKPGAHSIATVTVTFR
jgi:hypothetical protein